MTLDQLLPLAVLLPFAGFAVCRLLAPGSRVVARWVGPGSIGLSFLVFAVAALVNGGGAGHHVVYTWLGDAGRGPGLAVPPVDVDLWYDNLTAVMTLVVTGVGCLIHLYSTAYMDDQDDEGYTRFFGHMNLFVFAMLVLVTAANFVLLVIGWALVGLASYLLIGFDLHRPAAVAAARKAFVINVIGDVGIVIASFVALQATGSLDFDRLFCALGANTCSGAAPALLAPPPPGTLELIAFLLLVGAVAKSAQLPLHTWLPDAMEGPTPVSALLHAATMVTAGVYLIARFEPLYQNAPAAATTAAAIGALTALMAALIACVQTDVKRVLAYSTMSQIGYMFFAVAAGAEAAGIFHLVTHAFFKALLFLAAGNVIHALGGEQDMRRMGGLRRAMPWSFAGFAIGALALAGVPPLAGFFSKDEIIGAGLSLSSLHPLAGILLVVTAGLTAYYMVRALVLVFFGRPREATFRPHEAGPAMLGPVLALAALAAFGGLLQPGPWQLIGDWLARAPGTAVAEGLSGAAAALAVASGLLLIAAGMVAAALRFRPPGAAAAVPDLAGSRGPLARAFFWDDAYRALVVGPILALSRWLRESFDRSVVDGSVGAASELARGLGTQVRRLQSGYLRAYAVVFAAAVLLVVIAAGSGVR